MPPDEIDFHPIELAAHSILSGSLDSIHENFSLLHQSQHILITRLKHIEHRLQTLENAKDFSEEDVTAIRARIGAIQKQLDTQRRVLSEVDARMND